MEKKKITFIAVVLLAIILLLVMLFYFLSPKEKYYTDDVNNKKYYSQWSIENQRDLATSAVVEFLQQDSSETSTSRKKRLEKYFSGDSPVYDYKPDLLSQTVKNTSATVRDIKKCEEQEGGNSCLFVDVDITINKEAGFKNLTYWVTIIKDSENRFRVYDLGKWELGDIYS